jgi:ferritin-like metal-binding protein YciE
MVSVPFVNKLKNFEFREKYEMTQWININVRIPARDEKMAQYLKWQQIIEEFEDSPALDAGLLGTAQTVEHYEISRYGTWAHELGLNDAVSLLEDTLEEEKDTDATLTEMAEHVINQKAEAAQ